MFSENVIEDVNKQIIDNILKHINYGDIFMQYTPPEKDIKIEQKTPKTLNFEEILLRKRKKKKSSLLSTSKAISKKFKIRRNKNEELKFIKQVPLLPRDRLVRKVKNITSDNDITFMKQVSLHPRNRLKRLTKDIIDNMSTINYIDDDENVDDLSDAETVNYTNNATVKTLKLSPMQLQTDKIKKSIKILNEKSMKKTN